MLPALMLARRRQRRPGTPLPLLQAIDRRPAAPAAPICSQRAPRPASPPCFEATPHLTTPFKCQMPRSASQETPSGDQGGFFTVRCIARRDSAPTNPITLKQHNVCDLRAGSIMMLGQSPAVGRGKQVQQCSTTQHGSAHQIAWCWLSRPEGASRGTQHSLGGLWGAPCSSFWFVPKQLKTQWKTLTQNCT
jgi:hypothetical protein